MYLTHNIFYMFLFTFLVNMIVLPLIVTGSFNDISIINMNKIYLSIIAGLLMVVSQVYSFDLLHGTTSKSDYFIYAFLLVVYIYIYRSQSFVDDLTYLKDLKEKNSASILISSRKSKNKRINTFSNYIITTLQKENEFINKFL